MATGLEAVAALIRRAEQLATKQAGGRSKQSGPFSTFFLTKAVQASGEYAALHQLLPSADLPRGLHQCGIYENVLEERSTDPAAAWEYLSRHIGQGQQYLTAIEARGVWGDFRFFGSIDLSSGFMLRRFAEQEVAEWQPPTRHERLDPYVTSQYWFVTREGRGLLDQRRTLSPQLWPPTLARDRFWTDWYLPACNGRTGRNTVMCHPPQAAGGGGCLSGDR